MAVELTPRSKNYQTLRGCCWFMKEQTINHDLIISPGSVRVGLYEWLSGEHRVELWSRNYKQAWICEGALFIHALWCEFPLTNLRVIFNHEMSSTYLDHSTVPAGWSGLWLIIIRPCLSDLSQDTSSSILEDVCCWCPVKALLTTHDGTGSVGKILHLDNRFCGTGIV